MISWYAGAKTTFLPTQQSNFLDQLVDSGSLKGILLPRTLHEIPKLFRNRVVGWASRAIPILHQINDLSVIVSGKGNLAVVYLTIFDL